MYLFCYFVFIFCFFFFFKQKTAYEIRLSLVGSEMCIRDRSVKSLFHFPTHFLSDQIHYHSPRDAAKSSYAGRRSHNAPIPDNEKVVRRAFSHIAVSVQHQPLVSTSAPQLHAGEDVVQVVQALHGRVYGLRSVPAGGAGDDFQPVTIHLLRIQHDGGGYDEHCGFLTLHRVKTQVPHAPSHNQTDVAILQPVAPDGLQSSLYHVSPAHGNVQGYGLGGVIKALNVPLQLEHPAVIGADALKHSVSIEKPMVKHAELGFLFSYELSVKIDLHSNLPAPTNRHPHYATSPTSQATRSPTASVVFPMRPAARESRSPMVRIRAPSTQPAASLSPRWSSII